MTNRRSSQPVPSRSRIRDLIDGTAVQSPENDPLSFTSHTVTRSHYNPGLGRVSLPTCNDIYFLDPELLQFPAISRPKHSRHPARQSPRYLKRLITCGGNTVYILSACKKGMNHVCATLGDILLWSLCVRDRMIPAPILVFQQTRPRRSKRKNSRSSPAQG